MGAVRAGAGQNVLPRKFSPEARFRRIVFSVANATWFFLRVDRTFALSDPPGASAINVTAISPMVWPSGTTKGAGAAWVPGKKLETIVSFALPGFSQTSQFEITCSHEIVGDENSHNGVFRGFLSTTH